jgi:diguanylate cyclase (GGDEF)-like protein/PAS domain S-box-containing protein
MYMHTQHSATLKREQIQHTSTHTDADSDPLIAVRSTQPASLLVVDDNETNLDLLCRRLQRAGYRVTAAAGGEQALALIKTQAFALVLLDIMMPDIDGLTVLKRLRQQYSAAQLPVIMVTAKYESDTVVEALELGANDYVTKPIDFPVTLARIRTQLLRQQDEEALRDSEERYALAMHGANDGLWDWHLDTHEMYFSPRWKTMLGCQEDDVEPKCDAWFTRVHPEDRAVLHEALQAHLAGLTPHFEHEHRMLHADGTYRWMLCRGVAVRQANGRASRMAGSMTDITERKVVDALTGLPNRLLLLDRLGQAVARATRHPETLFAVLFLDLDRFKVVNNSLGPTGGDQLLMAVAQRLDGQLRDAAPPTSLPASPTVARLVGDQFLILLEEMSDITDATRMAERVRDALTPPLQINAQEVFITASIGIALSTTGYTQAEDILRDAEIAMRRAKEKGTAGYEVFDRAMHARATARLQLETELRHAIERHTLQVYYQPIVALTTGRISGFEALVRWPHPERGLIPPDEFIPIAEETGLILPLGAWVLQEACRQTCVWLAQHTADLFISVNLSGQQLLQPDLVPQIAQILQQTCLPTGQVKLEITETVLVDHVEAAIDTLTQLRALGIRVSLDDFGTGYSSLSYLHRFPLDGLKIDRSFVSRLDEVSEGTKIVQTIITLAHQLGLEVIAEGVETLQQVQHLKHLGCPYAQGYFFSRPIAAAAAETLLATRPQW